MEMRRYFGASILLVAIVLASGTLAMGKDQRMLNISQDATLNGTRVSAGEYKVEWVTHSPGATVSFLKGKKVLLTAEGKLVDRGRKYDRNTVIYSTAPDGTRTISEIRFAGQSEAIVFGE
jgi:hypothetical protein